MWGGVLSQHTRGLQTGALVSFTNAGRTTAVMPHSLPGPPEDPTVVGANSQACGFSNEEPTRTWKIPYNEVQAWEGVLMDRGPRGRRMCGGSACTPSFSLREAHLAAAEATIKDATKEGNLSLLLELRPQKSSPGLSFASTPANDPSQGSTPDPSNDSRFRRTQWSGLRAPHPP